MSVSIRIKSLHTGTTGADSLSSAEAHGKRLDASGKARRVRDCDALVYGSLDLREAYNRHVEGCKSNKALKKPIQHAVIHFPNDLAISGKTEQAMLDWAVTFINNTHGGQAVFAARLDRDEKGRHNVDVFFCPKYTKSTKARGDELWISPTKFGKALCKKHEDELVRRDKHGQFKTGPRQVGIALNSELRLQMAQSKVLAPLIKQKREKAEPASDWVSPEAYTLRQAGKKIEQLEKAVQRSEQKIAEKEASLITLHNAFAAFGEKFLVPIADQLPEKARSILNIFLKKGGKQPLDQRSEQDDDYSPPSSLGR